MKGDPTRKNLFLDILKKLRTFFKKYFHFKAFLGDEAEVFKSLTPEESKARLGEILEKVDTNKDGFVSVEELRVWIKDTGGNET